MFNQFKPSFSYCSFGKEDMWLGELLWSKSTSLRRFSFNRFTQFGNYASIINSVEDPLKLRPLFMVVESWISLMAVSRDMSTFHFAFWSKRHGNGSKIRPWLILQENFLYCLYHIGRRLQISIRICLCVEHTVISRDIIDL